METPETGSAMQPAQGHTPAVPPPTWAEWRQWQAKDDGLRRRAESASAFGERELARLKFQRWLVQAGRLTP